ncbi:MAG: NUDIX domain-containing protein [bacterium]
MPEEIIHTHVVLVTAFVRKGDKFLLAKRSSKDSQAGGMWALPGGKVDEDKGPEVIENTLKRELVEEVGVEIKDQISYIYSSSFVRSSGHSVINLCFLCDWKNGEAKPLEDHEEVRWFTLEELVNFSELPKYLKGNVENLSKFLRS